LALQVEDRLVQRPALAQKERDEQPSHTAIAVEKRVDGLELCVREASPKTRNGPEHPPAQSCHGVEYG
jgi:hypothetical protein